jgi:signal peptidase
MSSTAAVAGRHRALTRSTVTSLHVAPRRPVTEVPAVRRPLPRRVLGLLGNLILLVGVAAFLLIAVGPHVLGYHTSTMLTGSMEPGIMPGDVVVTTPEPASEVAVGDVISYQIPVEDHRVETHRVTKVIHNPDGTVAIQTKGDANENVDPWMATIEGDTVWEMQAVVPKLGTAIRLLRAPAVQHGLFWLALGGLLVLGLSTIWGMDEDQDEKNHHDGQAVS